MTDQHATAPVDGDTHEIDLSRSSDAWAELDDDSPLPPRRPRTITGVTWVLMAGCLAAGAFALGAKVGRDHAPTATATGATAALGGFGNRGAANGPTTTSAGRQGGATAATGAATGGAAGNAAKGGGFGGGAGFGGGTFGTVKLVDGTNVYIQDTNGNVIKVTTTPEAAITVSKRGTAADLKPGDTVVVQGTADADGTIAATAITAGGLGGGRQRGQNAGGQNGNGQAGAAAATTAARTGG